MLVRRASCPCLTSLPPARRRLARLPGLSPSPPASLGSCFPVRSEGWVCARPPPGSRGAPPPQAGAAVPPVCLQAVWNLEGCVGKGRHTGWAPCPRAPLWPGGGLLLRLPLLGVSIHLEGRLSQGRPSAMLGGHWRGPAGLWAELGKQGSCWRGPALLEIRAVLGRWSRGANLLRTFFKSSHA